MNKRIERADWPAFADEFSLENRGRPLTLEMVSATLGDETIMEGAPLMALDFDPQGDGALMFGVGAGDGLTTHVVSAPKDIWLEENDEEIDVALEVITDQGKTILYFDD